MANEVKWIKITTDIFDDEKFAMIDALPEADAIELIWFKLLVFAGKSNNNGIFFFSDRVAYTDEMLASVFHRPLNTVRMAMETFVRLGMIEKIEDVYAIVNWSKHQTLNAYENKKIRDREYSQKRRNKQRLEVKELMKTKKSSDESSDDMPTVERFCSYSISNSNSYSFNNHSNIENLNYILSDTDYVNSNYINNNIRLLEIIRGWMEYKDSKKPKTSNHYDTQQGMQKCLTQFVNADREFGTEEVCKAVDFTMGNNYQGVVWDKCKKNAKAKSSVESWLEVGRRVAEDES